MHQHIHNSAPSADLPDKARTPIPGICQKIIATCLADSDSTLVIRQPDGSGRGRAVPDNPNIEIAGLPATTEDKAREEWVGLVRNALVHIGSILPPDYKVRAL